MFLPLLLIIATTLLQGDLLYDFDNDVDLSRWMVVDDVVMGGRSQGALHVNQEGQGVFSGTVSLENNGGFSSIRHRFDTRSVVSFTKFVLRVKGDGKAYQFRVKSDRFERHSYVSEFKTSGSWETIEIPMQDMYPSFRGVRLNIPNYPGLQAEEIALLIGNKRPEQFELQIDWIGLR
ncbi:MAG: CIA30 family protein [Saprospiraceae bacterium]|nr:CIA30 family protein [Saprospiraceae bacterium]